MNNECQSMWIRGALETPHFVVQDCAASAGNGLEPLEFSDDAAEEALAEGFIDDLRSMCEDGPDEAVSQLLERVEGRRPIFRPRAGA